MSNHSSGRIIERRKRAVVKVSWIYLRQSTFHLCQERKKALKKELRYSSGKDSEFA